MKLLRKQIGNSKQALNLESFDKEKMKREKRKRLLKQLCKNVKILFREIVFRLKALRDVARQCPWCGKERFVDLGKKKVWPCRCEKELDDFLTVQFPQHYIPKYREMDVLP